MNPVKLMWMPDDDVLWDVATEQSLTATILPMLPDDLHSEIEEWTAAFGDEYRAWLSDVTNSVNDIEAPIVLAGRNLVEQLNSLPPISALYWFDIDRTDIDDFVWSLCPACGEQLTEKPDWNSNNRFVCQSCHLVLPA